ncbi:hypothetical protein GQ457_11G004970 [Hibiscus cannabinus]
MYWPSVYRYGLVGNWHLVPYRADYPEEQQNDVKKLLHQPLAENKDGSFLQPKPSSKKPSNLTTQYQSHQTSPHVLSKKISPCRPTIGNGNSYCVSKENDDICGWIDMIDTVNEELEVVEENNYGSLGELYLDDQLWNLFNP